MTDLAFSPFETHLDRDRALRILQGALAGADDGRAMPTRPCRG